MKSSADESRRCALVHLILLAVILAGKSQAVAAEAEPPRLVIKQLISNWDSLAILGDSLSSATVHLLRNNDTLNPSIDYDYIEGKIRLREAAQPGDTFYLLIESEYDDLDKVYFLREFRTRSSTSPPLVTESVTAGARSPRSDLQISGTKSFSTSVDDRGGINLSQGLAMTISGELGYGLKVRGSFSDRGVPSDRLVTRRFAELENIYLEAESDHVSARFGNFELKEERFQFLSLSRTVQGLTVGYRSGRHSAASSFSIPMGKFTTNTLSGSDGNYGPYFLRGRDGGGGIRVVEHSETVWLNGRKLARGKDQDYYVDYQRGELFFTANIVIHEQDRIRIDFEYQSIDYRQTLYSGSSHHEFIDGRLDLNLGLVALTESSNDPINFSLDDEEINVLKQAGDQTDKSQLGGARYVGVGNGDYIEEADSSGSIYRYVGVHKGDYQVTFSQVDKGDYLYLGSGEYLFVGRGQGRYLPIKRLPLPEALNVASVAGQYRFSDAISLSSELGVSNYDRNRLSGLDDSDNNSVASTLGLRYQTRPGRILGNVRWENLPSSFGRLSRLETVDENYLWQRQSGEQVDRQRFTADLSAQIGNHLRTRWEAGHTRESGNFRSNRMGLITEAFEIARSSLKLEQVYTSSRHPMGSAQLYNLKPQFQCGLLPLVVLFSGDFDHRKTTLETKTPIAESRRQGEIQVSYRGVALGGEQSENWRKEQSWGMLDKKRSYFFKSEHMIRTRGRIAANARLHRFQSSEGREENYETGSFDLQYSRFLRAFDLNWSLRMNRRGQSQTTQTYLRVDPGRGDYVLIDSAYVRQNRGDYIAVNEQVGTIEPTVETEKRAEVSINLQEVVKGPLTSGSLFHYEVNLREIGPKDADFNVRWLIPSEAYLRDKVRFLQRRDDYRGERFDPKLGLRTELSYRRRLEMNLLDLRRPWKRNSEEGKVLLRKLIVGRDYVELTVRLENQREEEVERYRVNLRKRVVRIAGRHYTQSWELGGSGELIRERTDSLNLSINAAKFGPEINYSMGSLGRIEFSSFAYWVIERENRQILRQMADGFPEGRNLAGDMKVDIRLGGNLNFQMLAHAEWRSDHDKRYSLRSELVSRFQ